MNSLKVGKDYNFYTNYSTIVGAKVKVIAILMYDECSKYAYDMSTLAINERVISVRDEDLKSEIDSDNIYYLRALNANADGTYNEYIVWDGIINYDKTIALDETYTSTLSINIDNSANVNISQIVSVLEKAIVNAYGTSVTIDITTPVSDSSSSTTTTLNTVLTEDTLTKAESIINSLNMFEKKLVPAAEKIISSNISENIENIGTDIDSIRSSISLIKHGL